METLRSKPIIEKQKGFTLPGIIISMMIMSIMSLGAVSASTLLVDLNRERLQKVNMLDIKRSLLESYEDTGTITTSLVTLDDYSSLDYSQLVDFSGAQFQILDNGGTPFSYNGSGATYVAAILTPYGDGLDSSIAANALTIAKSEAFTLIASNDLSNTLRGKTATKIAACNSAITNYTSAVGVAPVAPIDLVAGGYIEANKIIDEFGNNLVFDATPVCYSIGRNGINDLKAVDDIT